MFVLTQMVLLVSAIPTVPCLAQLLQVLYLRQGWSATAIVRSKS